MGDKRRRSNMCLLRILGDIRIMESQISGENS